MKLRGFFSGGCIFKWAKLNKKSIIRRPECFGVTGQSCCSASTYLSRSLFDETKAKMIKTKKMSQSDPLLCCPTHFTGWGAPKPGLVTAAHRFASHLLTKLSKITQCAYLLVKPLEAACQPQKLKQINCRACFFFFVCPNFRSEKGCYVCHIPVFWDFIH